jgi:NhaA family Na+:H+ antiporter
VALVKMLPAKGGLLKMDRWKLDPDPRKPALKLFRGPYGPTLRDGRYVYPWEKTLSRVVTPLDEFIHRQTTTGITLILATSVALVLANSPLREIYKHIIYLPIRLGIGDRSIVMPLDHWVNEGLMTFFFVLVGLEIKREIQAGELSDLRKALLPVIAALGGMLVPALIYRLLNPSPVMAMGWGIPMATDVAFCVAALVILGSRVPQSLMIFLVALAIIDDLGAVLVIAIYYTEQLDLDSLALTAGLLLLLIVLNAGGVRNPVYYGLIGVLVWFSLLNSGVHPTVSGILVAFSVPAKPSFHPERFSLSIRQLMDQFDSYNGTDLDFPDNKEQFALLQSLRYGLSKAEPPLRRIEKILHLPVALFVIPLFAFANAGIQLSPVLVSLVTDHTIAHGIFMGLILGKFIGITGFSWAAVRLGLASLPSGMGFVHIMGVGLLGGIGFTMSIFIAELCYGTFPELLLVAKTAIIFASATAGLLGIIWLLVVGGGKKGQPDGVPF